MSSVSTGGQSNKRLISIILVIVGVLFLILGVVYLAVPAHSLPGFIGYIKNGGTGKHNLRAGASLVVAVVCLVAAWFVNRNSKSAAGGQAASTSVDASSHS